MQSFDHPVLEAHKLSVAAGDKIICRELDIVVRPGECWGVLGQNGVGKTTLLRTMAGLHTPQTGRVTLHGEALDAHARQSVARQVGVLLQNEGGEFWGSVQEYVLLGRFPHRDSLFGYSAQDETLARQALAQVELEGLAHRSYNTLSGGERQRAAIAQALAQQAKCYLLDEPLQNLDMRHQIQTMQIFSRLKEQGCALMMVLHDIVWAQRYCDHVLLLFAGGRVLSGTVQALLTHTHLEALYQCRLRELSEGEERWFVAGV